MKPQHEIDNIFDGDYYTSKKQVKFYVRSQHARTLANKAAKENGFRSAAEWARQLLQDQLDFNILPNSWGGGGDKPDGDEHESSDKVSKL
jgi:hypothetical protein